MAAAAAAEPASVATKPIAEPVTEPAAPTATAEPAAVAATTKPAAESPSLEEQLPEAPTTVPVVPVSVPEVEQAAEAERPMLVPA